VLFGSELWRKAQYSNLIKTVKLNDNTFIEYYENRQVRKAENGEIIVQYYKRRLVGLF
jgi:hypothetical protein